MSLDQALLESVESDQQPVLRFYRWTPATLSLGYFQPAADRQLHPASLPCPIVRRASGGGAIVHDDELTYSICIRTSGAVAKANTDLYDTVHQAIRKALKLQSIEVELFGEGPAAKKSDPFLCFQRRFKGDLICGESKIGGSAQRRLKTALIQHGSLLLSQSSFAPELPGLAELAGREVDVDDLIQKVTVEIAAATGVEFSAGETTDAELQRAAEVEKEKFGAEAWLQRR